MFVLCLTLCYDKSLNGDMLILVEPSIRRYLKISPVGGNIARISVQT